ncbi:MAG: hypothetical protein M1829_000570 [Trizodia sp. TS-e1964]|nr:MAG: hypothetical protein M1829_000570 [Trizodia sp. TS-e1964]
MAPNDVTVDIPLELVDNSNTSSKNIEKVSGRSYEPTSPRMESMKNEKAGLFHRHEPAGRRRVRKPGIQGQSSERKSFENGEDTLNRMGVIYKKILNFSIVIRYFVFVLPLALLIAVPIVIGATVAQNAKLGSVRIVWFFTWIEIVWLSLWVSKLFARALPSIFEFFCGIVSSGTRKYALVLKSLHIPISLAGWAVTAFATFDPMMTRNPDNKAAPSVDENWRNIVGKILAALLVASLILLGEKTLIQLISINYHRTQLDAKIKDSKHNIFLLGLLYNASRTLFPAYCKEFEEEDYIINDSIAFKTSRTTTHQKTGSTTPMRLIQNIGRVGDKITDAFGNVAHEITGKQVFNPHSAHSIVVEALEKKKSSEALAKRLWMSFVVEGSDSLSQEDLIDVLGPERLSEAEECFFSLDKDGNGDVSLDEMIFTVLEYGRERHALANSLHDVDQAIHVLDKLLCAIAFIIIIFVFIGFFNANFTTTLATAGTALLSMSFVFAVTAQEVLGSCIFLFIKHPYDVGDRVDINNEPLTVEHISLLFSIFKRVDNHKTLQIPNIVLNTMWIDNISRSKAMRERIAMFINFDTSLEDIHSLRSELQAFVLDKENSRDFQKEIDVEVVGIAEMNKLELRVEIRHKSNWSNETLRAARRSKFMCALVLALRRVPIYGPGAGDAVLGDMAKPTYSVAVTDAQATANREEFAAKKEAKRLIPSKKAIKIPKIEPPSSGGTRSLGNHFIASSDDQSGILEDTRPSTRAASEKTAVDALNSRDPLAESNGDDWDVYREDGELNNREHESAEAHDRNSNIEEVRVALRRVSTRGRRKQPAPPITVNSAFLESSKLGNLTTPYLPQPALYSPERVGRNSEEDSSSIFPLRQQTPGISIHTASTPYHPTPAFQLPPIALQQTAIAYQQPPALQISPASYQSRYNPQEQSASAQPAPSPQS